LTSIVSERAFEEFIEAELLAHGGYGAVPSGDFDRVRCLNPKEVFAFLRASQPKVLADLAKHHGDLLEVAILDALVKALDTSGSLSVLRHGFKFFGKTLHLAYFAPANTLNPDSLARYAMNRLAVSRQLRFIPDKNDSVDLALLLNGIPVVTVELKNPFTGQTHADATKQFIKDRDPRHLLFAFKKRSLVHFAVDTDQAWMTTQLNGKGTTFLPFNLGRDKGAGNPENPHGHRTAYLWDDVWRRDSLLDILGRFVHLAVSEKKYKDGRVVRKEAMIFPRYHQLDVVRKMAADARQGGAGRNYLIQHSAGSGKSNSIAWIAHRLSNLHDGDNRKIFDSVVVVTDRLVLDRQLQDTIYQFEHKQGVVQRIEKDSQQLADALTNAVPIIITTLQKFPFVAEKVGELPQRRYAVIVDEAHSSQTGEAAGKLKGLLGVPAEDDDTDDAQDEVVKVAAGRGRHPNLSYFAFTATPKFKTLKIFGRPGVDGKPEPFHLYSMRQAVEEGFILDVLKNYTTYKRYYKLLHKGGDDREVEKKKAAKALARFVELHPTNISQKTEVIIEHFRSFTRKKIGGQAKAMVVTGSRLHAVRYKLAFDAYIKKKGYTDVNALVAFSGEVEDPDTKVKYTEVGMNGGLREAELPERFEEPEYQVLLVAEKYQTGFDQPLLHTMYVDKKLANINAVQTLSRLNRIHPGKEDTFVLDFVNEPADIQEAFQPFYEQTIIGEDVDPQRLYELMSTLDEAQIWYRSDVEGFAKVFFAAKHGMKDHARLNAFIDPAASRYKGRTTEEQDAFKKSLRTFVHLYSFLSQILPYQDADLEKRYAYGRFLLTKIKREAGEPEVDLGGDVALQYYRLQKASEGDIGLTVNEPAPVWGPTEVGSGNAKPEYVVLATIIEALNQRFGTDFTIADQLFVEQIRAEAVADPDLVRTAQANTLDHFRYVFTKALERLFIDRMEQNEEFFAKFMNDREFQTAFTALLMPQVYGEIRRSVADDPP
jgi:type I restriction enzyme R subunit